MDAIVTARVPVEIKEQVGVILREIGSTPTKLINSAYEYVLRHHALPQEDPEIPAEMTVRVATPEMIAALDSMTLELPQEFLDELDAIGYKEFIARGRMADYEALA